MTKLPTANRSFATHRRRQFLKASAAALFGLALSTCGRRLGNVQSPTTSAASSASDKLYVYTWAQYTDKELLNSFTAKTGIQVVADVYDSNETMLAKLQAGGGGAYSVIYPSDYMVRRMVELDLLRQLEHTQLAGLDNLYPRFQNPSYDPHNRHSVPFGWGTTGLLYNSNKLAVAPVDWDYLWVHQQQLSKRMTLLNDVREVMGGVLRMLGYSYNSKNESQIKQAYEKLKAILPAIAAFDTDAWQNQILAGDLLLAMSYSSDAIRVIKENPSLKYVIPRSGSSLWTDTMVIPKTAPNPDGAYAWIDYMLQAEVAAQMCQRLSFATPNQVAVEQLPPQVRNNPNLFPPEWILQKCERIAPLGEIDAVYERYWTQLTSS
jgi:spermidine/putrescine transport system substrate-binding protein